MAETLELSIMLINVDGNRKSNPGDRRSSTPSEGGARRESTPSAAGGETKPSRVSNNSEDTSSYEEKKNVAGERRNLIENILDNVLKMPLANLFILCQDAIDGGKKKILTDRFQQGGLAPSCEKGQQNRNYPPEAGVFCHLTGSNKMHYKVTFLDDTSVQEVEKKRI